MYRAYYENYSDNDILSSIFTITVIDPCDEPVSVTSKTLTDQEYTITQAEQTYQVPVYDADPVWCAITYSYEIVDIAGDAAMTFDSDAAARQFAFSQNTDLTLSGATSNVYTIAVKGEAGNVVKTSDTATFSFTIKNPCIDPTYVTIEKAVLLNQIYELHEFDPVGYEFTHDPFVIKTLPFDHSLCGSLTYTSTFMTVDIDETIAVFADPMSDPVRYDQSTLTHAVYSEDFALLGLRPYTVKAFLTDYAVTTTDDATATIEFLDPCPDPESVVSVLQTNPVDYYYTA